MPPMAGGHFRDMKSSRCLPDVVLESLMSLPGDEDAGLRRDARTTRWDESVGDGAVHDTCIANHCRHVRKRCNAVSTAPWMDGGVSARLLQHADSRWT